MSFQKFPLAISKVDDDLHQQMLADFPCLAEGIVQVGSEKWLLPAKFEPFADQIYNFEARPDDVWICTVPRSGTTWTQEMIWLICNGLDYETAFKKPLDARFPYLEICSLTHYTSSTMKWKSLEDLSNLSSRRFLKTHLPMKLMPRSVKEVGAKVVYVARNPKDVCVSWYHFQKTVPGGFTKDFESLSKYFMNDLTIFTPYWKHVLDGWQNRHLENVHFMFYEESKADLASSLKKLADFLGHPFNDGDLPKLIKHLSIESFRKNSSINVNSGPTVKDPTFVRRGLVGGNPEMTPEFSEKFDEWMKHNLIDTDFKFPVNVYNI